MLTAQAPRAEKQPAEGVLWLDCYNANPQSVLASLHTFFDCGLRGALILGSIGELGAASAELHERLGQSIAHILRDAQSESEMSVFTVGEDARHLARGLTTSGGAHLGHFEPSDLSALIDQISHLNPPAIFVKGSRSVRLERVAMLLKTSLTETRNPS